MVTNHRLTRRGFLRLGALTVAGALLTACGPTMELLETPAERGRAMNIGVVVYSQTGHTLSVARALHEKLVADGRSAHLEQVETIGKANPSATGGALKAAPPVDEYDALVIGSPVWGGKPAWPTATYLNQIAGLQGKRVAIMATGALPAAIGRNQTIAELAEVCQSKGAEVVGSGSVCWFSPRRGKQIAQVVESLSSLF